MKEPLVLLKFHFDPSFKSLMFHNFYALQFDDSSFPQFFYASFSTNHALRH